MSNRTTAYNTARKVVQAYTEYIEVVETPNTVVVDLGETTVVIRPQGDGFIHTILDDEGDIVDTVTSTGVDDLAQGLTSLIDLAFYG